MPARCVHWVGCSLSASRNPYSVGTLAAKTSLGDVQSTLYITPPGSAPRELLGSTNGGLAGVIDAALGMLLGCETSGTAAHLYVVP